jgi:hypothetical protein
MRRYKIAAAIVITGATACTTGLLAPSYPGVFSCSASRWINALEIGSAPTCSRLAFGNISDTLPNSQLAPIAAYAEKCDPAASIANPKDCVRPLLNVTNFGATGNGTTDDTAAIQSAVSAGAGANSYVYFPCGTYLINSVSITISNNTRLVGAGRCAVIKGGALLANSPNGSIVGLPVSNPPWRLVMTNGDWVNGGSNIIIEDLKFDLTVAAPSATASTSALLFNKVNGARIENVSVVGDASGGAGSADGIGFISSSNYSVAHNSVVNVNNACYDNWGGGTDFVIEGNFCDQKFVSSAYGILITGQFTNLTPATTARGRVIDNVIRNAGPTGIWVQGGWNQATGGGATYGSVVDVTVTGNVIDTITKFHGIRVSDSSRINISNNAIRSPSATAITVSSEYLGNQTDLIINGNVISQCNASAGANPCVFFGSTNSKMVFSNNRIVGSGQSYDVQISNSSSNVVITGNSMDSGSAGRIQDQSAGAVVNSLVETSTSGFAISPTDAAGPGAGFLKLGVMAGTTGGTCKLVAYAGTSTTPTTIIDNVGGGC